jgi:predicted ATP-grasp superfamily ATP-dependent carboligase
VIGDMDLVRPLGLAGIPCAVPDTPGSLPPYSRFVRATFPRVDPETEPARFADGLADFGARQAEPPVLFFEGDWDLLAISRHRDRLAGTVRFVVADADLIEDLVDKMRFQELARRVGLPVPAAVWADPHLGVPRDLPIPFPLVVKPLTRHTTAWNLASHEAKAIEVPARPELEALWPSLAGVGGEVLLQELVPGPETRVESYHVYLDADGAIAGEFTGRKIRTWPDHHGHSTALEITAAHDVRELGRDLVARMGLRGVAKLDFKRTPDGELRLLEVNPRFSLWHHLGAIAGVNIPALVYADVTGRPRPAVREARAGTRWCHPVVDFHARHVAAIPLTRWLLWLAGTEAKAGLALDDPRPPLERMIAVGRAWSRSHSNRGIRRAAGHPL